MALTKQDVEHIARLARLGLTEEEKEKFVTQLSSILDYVEQLKEVNTDGIEPTAQVTGLVNRTRPDNVTDECLTQEDALSGSKNTHNNMFKVGQLVDTLA